MPSRCCNETSRSRICAWVVTSSAVVGSSAINSLGSHEIAMAIMHALAHAARETVRILAEQPRRLGKAHQLQQLGRTAAGGAARHRLVLGDRLDDLVADREHGIERGHRLLKNHADAVAANRPQRARVELDEIAPVEQDLPADDAAGRIGDQAQDRQCRDRFSATGLPDDRDGLSRIDREAHVVDGLDDVAGAEETGPQVADVEKRHLDAPGLIAEAAIGYGHLGAE